MTLLTPETNPPQTYETTQEYGYLATNLPPIESGFDTSTLTLRERTFVSILAVQAQNFSVKPEEQYQSSNLLAECLYLGALSIYDEVHTATTNKTAAFYTALDFIDFELEHIQASTLEICDIETSAPSKEHKSITAVVRSWHNERRMTQEGDELPDGHLHVLLRDASKTGSNRLFNQTKEIVASHQQDTITEPEPKFIDVAPKNHKRFSLARLSLKQLIA